MHDLPRQPFAKVAERLIFAIEKGSLYMAQEPEDAPEGGTRIQTRATVYEPTEPSSAR